VRQKKFQKTDLYLTTEMCTLGHSVYVV